MLHPARRYLQGMGIAAWSSRFGLTVHISILGSCILPGSRTSEREHCSVLQRMPWLVSWDSVCAG